mmetsp:Transcript_11633/g.20219  ORF Transcript_11633/g.20219 Transcript_11633/m.20219 type:complete len:223 (+) Transcript_11633:266-934(+)
MDPSQYTLPSQKKMDVKLFIRTQKILAISVAGLTVLHLGQATNPTSIWTFNPARHFQHRTTCSSGPMGAESTETLSSQDSLPTVSSSRFCSSSSRSGPGSTNFPRHISLFPAFCIPSSQPNDMGRHIGSPSSGIAGSFFIMLCLDTGGASHIIIAGKIFFSVRPNPVDANISSPSLNSRSICSYCPDSLKSYPNLSFNASCTEDTASMRLICNSTSSVAPTS